jgi:hypothetical protein
MGDEGRTDFKRVEDNLKMALTVQPGMKVIPTQYPIQLTPHTPYVMGRAALVFVLPHVLSPAADLAEYGWADFDDNYGWLHSPPNEAARVVGWFRPSDAGRKYNVDFSCEGQPGHSFMLTSSGGVSETVHLATDNLDYPELAPLVKVSVGKTFTAQNQDWKWFNVSGDGHWKLLSLEVVQFPDS